MPLRRSSRRRATCVLVAALAVGVAGWAAPSSEAQEIPPLVSSSTTTTSTTAPPTTEGGSQPSGSDFSQGSSQAPAGAKDAQGDGTAAPAGGIVVPPQAQRIIDSVHRTAPSSDAGLLAQLDSLRALGMPEDEVLRVGLGRFPIAGPARYSHDWLYPRYGPGFRFHLGTDVFAAYGTPVRAPVDGVATTANGGLGGLTVKVHMPDGTYFYLAHLSGLVDGFTDGMAVRTGDIVGYVGDSGNARGGAPHLHIGIYPRGGPPVDPKPILDQFLYEAAARVPALAKAYRAAKGSAPAPDAVAATPELAVPALGTSLLHDLAEGSAPWPIEALYVASVSVLNGPHVMIDLAVDDIVSSIDWSARSAQVP
ncbi:MAG: M23 family metallopeptidase [Acidimicrobiales bacterium]